MKTLTDEPEQGALFCIEGPDEDGCVWMCSTEGRDVWCQNLGPSRKVVEVMSQWLGDIRAKEDRERTPSRRERMESWDADVARLDKAQSTRKGPIDFDEVEKKG